jgi:hypothetical protein
MVGAGIGLMIDTWGASTPLSVGLIGAGIGAGVGSAVGGGLVTSRGDINWTGYGRGGVIGGIAGFSGGFASATLAPLFGGGVAGGAITGFSGGVIGDITGQSTALALGWQERYNIHQTLVAGGLGTFVGGAVGYFDKGLSGLTRSIQGVSKGSIRPPTTVEGGTIVQRSQGVIVRRVGDVFVKEIDENASWFCRWWGRGTLEAQVRGLQNIDDIAPDFLYSEGRLVLQNAGEYTPGTFLSTWFRGSLRLGTPFNDIRWDRNIGAAGTIFDPAKHPIQQFGELFASGMFFETAILYYRLATTRAS